MATKKSVAKRASAKKGAAEKIPAKATAAKRSATGKSAAKSTAAKKAAAKRSSAARKGAQAGQHATAKKTAARGKQDDNYTKPELREKIKREVIAGDKGGRAGQWSARKAQLVAHEYKAEGGGYKHPRNEAQESLKSWGDEHWHTADDKPAIQGQETHRYLPDEAWKELSAGEKKATDEKKVKGSRQGKQFVPNTRKAKAARSHATE